MELIISSFVLVVIFFILSISLSGKGQRIAKEFLKGVRQRFFTFGATGENYTL